MNKTIRRFLILLLAITAAVCAVTGLAACGGVQLESLSIENARTDFRIGDEFEYGESFKVYANYSDNTRVDVTDQAEKRKEAGFDMDTPGDYQITVSYENKREVYTVYVSNFENVLRKIELDTANVKTSFKLGESVSFAGLMVTSTLENAQGNLFTSTTSSLRGLKVEVTDENSNVISDIFPSLGNFTVTVSSEANAAVKASYNVSVQDIDISSVQGAITVGNFYRTEVVSGNRKMRASLAGRDFVDTFECDYVFGDAYTRITETIDDPRVEHWGVDGQGIFGATVRNGGIESNYNLHDDMMNGAPVLLWYNSETEYGAEALLNNLYQAALECTNRDLVESADEAAREYSFEFSGLRYRSNSYDFYLNKVTFKLGEKYNVEEVELTQTYYENNMTAAGVDGWVQNFFTDDDGITTANPESRPTHVLIVNFKQVTGERTEINPYNRNMFKIQAYNLMYNGRILNDGDVVDYAMMPQNSNNISLSIVGIMPVTANLSIDPLYLSSDNAAETTVMLTSEGFYAYPRGNTIEVTFRNGGSWRLQIRTENTLKTIYFNVTGLAPTSMTANLYNEASGSFYSGDTKLIALNGSVYFYGAVNQYANPAQAFAITSGNAAAATVEAAVINGINCYKFSSGAEGVYTVRVWSTVASPECTFTFTVSDVPDYAGILQGNYTAVDDEESIFALNFYPGDTELSGTVQVVKTPTDEDGLPVTDEIKTATYSYVVDVDNLSITLTLDNGENLGLGLTVNAAGQLVLIDQYRHEYVLQRPSSPLDFPNA